MTINWCLFLPYNQHGLLIPVVCLFDLGLTSLSTIFQSYCNGVWMWQGAPCSLLECCLTEISCPRHFEIPVVFHCLFSHLLSDNDNKLVPVLPDNQFGLLITMVFHCLFSHLLSDNNNKLVHVFT